VRLLVLGGTVFLGRHLVDAALARGHEVTLFNRGQTNSELFPDVERLRGDRDGDLSALERGSWDAVVDTSGYVPRVVRASAELLADRVEHYTFVSSVSAYGDFSRVGLSEDDAVEPLAEESEDVAEHYGPLKALCEQAVESVFPGRSLVVRPGIIVGPHDPTDRFTYWPVRSARGGEVLAPGDPNRQVQVIDCRDLAAWMVRLVEDRVTGTLNATGPGQPLTMEGMLAACGAEELTWVSDEFLLEREVGPWMELPLWVSGPEWAGLLSVDISRAVAAGLSFRPIEETARDTLAWASSRELTKAGLAPERESELLREWHDRSG